MFVYCVAGRKTMHLLSSCTCFHSSIWELTTIPQHSIIPSIMFFLRMNACHAEFESYETVAWSQECMHNIWCDGWIIFQLDRLLIFFLFFVYGEELQIITGGMGWVFFIISNVMFMIWYCWQHANKINVNILIWNSDSMCGTT